MSDVSFIDLDRFESELVKGLVQGLQLAIVVVCGFLFGFHATKAVAEERLFGDLRKAAIERPAGNAGPRAASRAGAKATVGGKPGPEKAAGNGVKAAPRFQVSPPPTPTRTGGAVKVEEKAANAGVERLIERMREEIKASLAEIKNELAAKNRRLRRRIARLERKTVRLEREVRKLKKSAATGGTGRTAGVGKNGAAFISPHARILATVQIEGEWMAWLQLDTYDKRRVRVGSVLGDLTVKDIQPRRVVLENAKGQRVVLSIAG